MRHKYYVENSRKDSSSAAGQLYYKYTKIFDLAKECKLIKVENPVIAGIINV